MKNLIVSISLLSLVIVSCNNSSNESASNSADRDTSSEVLTTSTEPIESILDPYFELKNALTNDDDKAAAQAGTNVLNAFKNFDQSSLNDAQAKLFADVKEDAMEHAEHINSNAGNLKHQREHFETLSEEVYELAKSVGGTRKLYYTNCPMYNNNKGANWLSEVKEIRNPYLGKEMLECGTVKEEIN